jgi:hypothetical protein
MTVPGKLCPALLFLSRLLTKVHWPLTKDDARQFALKEQALLQAARLAYPACEVMLLLAGYD